MSLFSRKTFLDGESFRQVVSISLSDLDPTGITQFGGDILGKISGADAAAEAAALAAAGGDRAIAEQRRQFDLTRSDLLPFLEAATGTPAFGVNPEFTALEQQIADLESQPTAGIFGGHRQDQSLAVLRAKLEATPKEIQTGREGGALQQFISGIEQAPTAPTLQEFTFDPRAALDDPEFQFIREQGNIAADRAAAANRQLGSGNRLLAAQEFGQGLATSFLPQQFAQQQQLSQIENNRLLQQHALGLQSFNDRLNRLGGIVDVGRGTGGTLGQLGQQSAATIGGLQQGIGQAQAAGVLGEQQGFSNLLNLGLTGAGFALGGPAGGVATSQLSPFGSAPTSFSPIGAQDAPGFFS